MSLTMKSTSSRGVRSGYFNKLIGLRNGQAIFLTTGLRVIWVKNPELKVIDLSAGLKVMEKNIFNSWVKMRFVSTWGRDEQ